MASCQSSSSMAAREPARKMPPCSADGAMIWHRSATSEASCSRRVISSPVWRAVWKRIDSRCREWNAVRLRVTSRSWMKAALTQPQAMRNPTSPRRASRIRPTASSTMPAKRPCGASTSSNRKLPARNGATTAAPAPPASARQNTGRRQYLLRGIMATSRGSTRRVSGVSEAAPVPCAASAPVASRVAAPAPVPPSAAADAGPAPAPAGCRRRLAASTNACASALPTPE